MAVRFCSGDLQGDHSLCFRLGGLFPQPNLCFYTDLAWTQLGAILLHNCRSTDLNRTSHKKSITASRTVMPMQRVEHGEQLKLHELLLPQHGEKDDFCCADDVSAHLRTFSIIPSARMQLEMVFPSPSVFETLTSSHIRLTLPYAMPISGPSMSIPPCVWLPPACLTQRPSHRPGVNHVVSISSIESESEREVERYRIICTNVINHISAYKCMCDAYVRT